MSLYYREMNSPVGQLKLVASEAALIAVLWQDGDANRVKLPAMIRGTKSSILDHTESQLREYFASQRKHFDLPLKPIGTEFQKKVWRALSQIPFGVTKSYGELAKAIGFPKASRAVGQANGKNPLSIIVPCHRVIGSNGQLTGFAGGLTMKATLLRLERADA